MAESIFQTYLQAEPSIVSADLKTSPVEAGYPSGNLLLTSWGGITGWPRTLSLWPQYSILIKLSFLYIHGREGCKLICLPLGLCTLLGVYTYIVDTKISRHLFGSIHGYYATDVLCRAVVSISILGSLLIISKEILSDQKKFFF